MSRASGKEGGGRCVHFLSTRRRYRCRNSIIPLSCKTMIACRNESVFRDIQLPTRRYSPRASNSEKNERRRADADRSRARRCRSR